MSAPLRDLQKRPPSKQSNSSDTSSNDNDSGIRGSQSDGWQDVEPEESEEQYVCFYKDATFPIVLSLLEHCRATHDLDVVRIRNELGLDFYGTIKLVNYLRAEVEGGKGPLKTPSKEDLQNDKYLQPVLEDDALLFSLDEVAEPGAEALKSKPGTAERADAPDPLRRITELEEELRRVQSQFTEYRLTVKKVLDDRIEKQDQQVSSSGVTQENTNESEDGAANPDAESHYFTSYSYNEIHETMLKDTIRTDAYRDFIYDNKDLFQGKVVLDVGCGTGILSMFCAKAGAKQVIAVDNSDIVDKARQNVFENHLEGTITCLKGKIEEVDLPVAQVDIIISEWMGYCLLYEAMLDSVLWARDRYLSSTGLMVPSHTTLYLAPLSDPDYISSHIAFWHSVYGFSMTSMLASIYDDVLSQRAEPETLAAPPSPFLRLNLYETKTSDLTFTAPFTTTLAQDIDALDGWVIWFDMFFLTSREEALAADATALEWTKQGGRGVAFTTGPKGPETHWRQGVLLVDHKNKRPQPLKGGQTIKGTVGYKKPKESSRELDVQMTWALEKAAGEGDGEGKERKQSWRL